MRPEPAATRAAPARLTLPPATHPLAWLAAVTVRAANRFTLPRAVLAAIVSSLVLAESWRAAVAGPAGILATADWMAARAVFPVAWASAVAGLMIVPAVSSSGWAGFFVPPEPL